MLAERTTHNPHGVVDSLIYVVSRESSLADLVDELRPSASVVLFSKCEELRRALAGSTRPDVVIVDPAVAESPWDLIHACDQDGICVAFTSLEGARNVANALLQSSIDDARPHISPPSGGGRPSVFEGLSRREFEVLAHIVEGLANKQIAGRLFLSVRTVEKHRASVTRKLKTRSVAELTRMWIQAVENPPDINEQQ